MGSDVVGRIAVGEDTGEIGSGNNVPQPPCLTIANTARLVLEQRQLGFLYTVVSRDIATVRHRRENTATVNHLLAHEVNFGIAPCTSRSTTIRNSVRQIDSVFQNMTAESVLDSNLRICKVSSIHLTTNITACRDIRCIHLCVIQASVRHNDYMVRNTDYVTAV